MESNEALAVLDGKYYSVLHADGYGLVPRYTEDAGKKQRTTDRVTI